MNVFGWMYEDSTHPQPFKTSFASINSVVEEYLLVSPAVTYDPAEFELLMTVSSNVPQKASFSSQTDEEELSKPPCKATGTQTRNK